MWQTGLWQIHRSFFPRKSNFKQFAKVFSRKRYPLYSNLDFLSSLGVHLAHTHWTTKYSQDMSLFACAGKASSGLALGRVVREGGGGGGGGEGGGGGGGGCLAKEI